MRNNKWKKFERLAAAVRSAEQRGADVKWNTRLAGHRFDVALRAMYEDREFLIVVDVIDDGALVTAARVGSFTAKVESAAAHVGVLASLSEARQDAFEMTGEHPVWLITPKFMDGLTDDALPSLFTLVLHHYEFGYMLADGSGKLVIPEEPEILSFMMKESRIKGPGIDATPEQLVAESRGEVTAAATGKPQTYEISLPKGTSVTHPNFQATTPVTSFTFTYRFTTLCDVISPRSLDEDPYLAKLHIEEELAKRNPAVDTTKIENGFDTTLRPGNYYYNPRLRFSYHCEKANKREATMVLVESYQMGKLFQARANMSPELAAELVEVNEQNEIDRLARMYEQFTLSDKNLEERFKVFLRDLEEAECIDDLALTPEQQRANKADYFFDHRTIVGELKTLYTDTAQKVEAILAPYRETPEWPFFFGAQSLQKILDHLPDKERINAKIVEAVTASIEGVVEKANRQIRATKETFGVPDAGGLLIILNDAVDILSPDLVAYRVRKSLRKTNSEEGLRFPHVSVVLVIGGAHYAQMTPALKGHTLLIIPNTTPEAAKVEEFVGTVNAKWSAFEKSPLLRIETEDFPKLSFKPSSEDKRARGPLTRHDYWSAQYARKPYLRLLSHDDLLDFGAHAVEELGARFLKGAPQVSHEQMERMMIRWSHFLDEVKHRGIDMKQFAQKTDGMGPRLEALYQHYQQHGSE